MHHIVNPIINCNNYLFMTGEKYSCKLIMWTYNCQNECIVFSVQNTKYMISNTVLKSMSIQLLTHMAILKNKNDWRYAPTQGNQEKKK